MKKAAQLSYIRFPLFPRARERISVKDICRDVLEQSRLSEVMAHGRYEKRI